MNNERGNAWYSVRYKNDVEQYKIDHNIYSSNKESWSQ